MTPEAPHSEVMDTRFAVASSAAATFAVYPHADRAQAVIDLINQATHVPAVSSGFNVAPAPADTELRPIPPKALELLQLASERKLLSRLLFATDSGGSPFFTIETRPTAEHIAAFVTWHTRATGRYRLFACKLGKTGRMPDSSLAKVLEHVRTAEAPSPTGRV